MEIVENFIDLKDKTIFNLKVYIFYYNFYKGKFI